MRAARRLDEAGSARGRTFERLASGSRINHASDDAAGLAVASSLNLESRVNSQAVRNISDGVSFLNVADGATKELNGVLVRLRELATQSSNGAFSDAQRASLDKEARALQAEYNRVVDTTRFNGVSVFAGSVSIQAGAGAAAVLAVGVPAKATIRTLGDGTFKARKSFATGTGSITTADLNGDGVMDLVSADCGSNTTSVLLGNGDGTFRARRSLVSGSLTRSVSVADFNGDGVPDLVTSDYGDGTTSVLLGAAVGRIVIPDPGGKSEKPPVLQAGG